MLLGEGKEICFCFRTAFDFLVAFLAATPAFFLLVFVVPGCNLATSC